MPSSVACAIGGHRWRRIVNDRSEDCDYCVSCGRERHLVGSAAEPVVRPPSPSWPARRMSVWLGRRAPLPSASALSRVVDHVELGRWLRARGLDPGRGSGGREDVQDVAMSLAVHRHLLYLEFGVYRGASLRRWSRTVTDPDAHFVGFDSFEGLPEDWLPEVRTGHFSTGGQAPSFPDPRVRLVPGWFEETVPRFAPPEHDLLVIAIDCDLYSSARDALSGMAPHIVPGTLIYLDEFSYASGELRAFEEFLQTTGTAAVQVVARSDNWAHWLFRVLPSEDGRRARPELTAPR